MVCNIDITSYLKNFREESINILQGFKIGWTSLALEQRASLLTEIVRQGIREGVFTTEYPDQAGEVIASMLKGMENTHAKLLLSFDQKLDERGHIERIVAIHSASSRFRKSCLYRSSCSFSIRSTPSVYWKCRNCGHIHEGTEAPEVCPVCFHPKAYFEVLEKNY